MEDQIIILQGSEQTSMQHGKFEQFFMCLIQSISISRGKRVRDPRSNTTIPTTAVVLSKHIRLTRLAIEQKVSPVGIRLHKAPVEQLVDGAAQHQPRHVISDLLRFLFKSQPINNSQIRRRDHQSPSPSWRCMRRGLILFFCTKHYGTILRFRAGLISALLLSSASDTHGVHEAEQSPDARCIENSVASQNRVTAKCDPRHSQV